MSLCYMGHILCLTLYQTRVAYQDYAQELRTPDEIALLKIEKYLDKYGYPKKTEVGKKAMNTPWLIIHHYADLEVRNRNFDAFYNAYLEGNINEIAMSLYLRKNYYKTFGKRLKIKNPFTTEEEIKRLIKVLNFTTGNDHNRY